MSLINASPCRSVGGISETERWRIMAFLQGAVYCWCKNRKGEWFALRDLVGGDNNDWHDTPLFSLYKKHRAKSNDPVKDAGKDAGWLLKSVLSKDKRIFDDKDDGLVKHYRWIEGEENT